MRTVPRYVRRRRNDSGLGNDLQTPSIKAAETFTIGNRLERFESLKRAGRRLAPGSVVPRRPTCRPERLGRYAHRRTRGFRNRIE